MEDRPLRPGSVTRLSGRGEALFAVVHHDGWGRVRVRPATESERAAYEAAHPRLPVPASVGFTDHSWERVDD